MLAVGQVHLPLEQLARATAELDTDDRVVHAVGDVDGQAPPALEIGLPPIHGRDEPGEGEDAGRERPRHAQPQRVRHHGSLREPAQDRAPRRDARLLSHRAEPVGEHQVRLPEGRGVRVADPLNGVPVMTRLVGDPQRCLRGERGQASPRVEQVQQRKQVVLVDPAPVQEDQYALGLRRRGSQPVDQVVE